MVEIDMLIMNNGKKDIPKINTIPNKISFHDFVLIDEYIENTKT